MSRINWDATGERYYETGVQKGVLYKQNSSGAYPNGVAWNGLTAVNESPSGAEATPLYADDQKYLNLISAEDYGATVECYTYPDEFAECDGSAAIADGVTIGQQRRTAFGMCYRTRIGNDVDDELGYKLNVIYGAKASPSERSHSTVNDSPEAMTLSYTLTTTPVAVTGYKATAHLHVDSRTIPATKLADLEAILYGVDSSEFSASSTYAKDTYVTHAGTGSVVKLYRAKAAISTAGEWDAEDWDEVGAPGPRLPLPDEIATLVGTTAV